MNRNIWVSTVQLYDFLWQNLRVIRLFWKSVQSCVVRNWEKVMQKFWKFLDLCHLSVHKVTWYVWTELASHKTCLMKCIFHDWLTPAAGRLPLQLSFPPDKVLAQRISCFFGIASNVSSKQAHGKIDQMRRMNGQEKLKRPENDGLRILLWGD